MDFLDGSLGGISTHKDIELYYASVLSINEANRTCNVRILGDDSFPISDVPYCSPAVNPDGSGIDFIPTIGSVCIVVKQLSNLTSEFDNSPFILSFRPKQVKSDMSWQGERPSLAQGDICLSSAEMNRLELLTSGVVKLMANEACSLEMYPDSHRIQTFCSNYVLRTSGGSVEWLTDIAEDIGASQFKAVIKSSGTTEVGAGELFIFEAGDSGVPKVIMNVLDPSDSTVPPKFIWECTSTGAVTIETRSTISVTSDESMAISAGGGLGITTPIINCNVGSTNISASSSDVIVDSPKVTIITDDFTVQSRSGEQIFVRGALEELEDSLNKQLVTEDALDWIFNHVHPGSGAPALGRPLDTSEIATSSTDTSAQTLNVQSSAAEVNSAILAPLEAILAQFVAGDPLVTPLLPLLPLFQAFMVKYTEEKAGAISSSTGANIPSAGVINSYSEVLTQDTKVR
jgi:hypothetical protein